MTDEFDERIDKAFRRLADEFQNREQLANQLRLQIDQRTDQRFDSLQNQLRGDFDSMVQAHRDHIIDLYKKFERIVWLSLVLIAAVTAFVGYQELTSLPNKISKAIERVEEQSTDKVDKILSTTEKKLKTIDEKIDDKFRKIDGEITTLVTSVENAATTARGEIPSKLGPFNIQIANAEKQITAAEKRINDAATSTEKAASAATEKAKADFAEAEEKIDKIVVVADEKLNRRIDDAEIVYKAALDAFRLQDDLDSLGRENNDPARLRRLFDEKNFEEDLNENQQLIVLEHIVQNGAPADLQPRIIVMLEALEPSTRKKASLFDKYQVTLGLQYAVPRVIKHTKSMLQSTLDPELLLSLLDQIDRLLDIKQISDLFREDLLELVKHEELGIRRKTIRLLVEFSDYSPEESTRIAEFIMLARQGPESADLLIQFIVDLPASRQVLFALLDVMESADVQEINRQKISKEATKYLYDNRGDRQFTQSIIAHATRTLRETLAADAEEARGIIALIVLESKFAASSLVAKLAGDIVKRIIESREPVDLDERFGESDYALVQLHFLGGGGERDVRFMAQVQQGSDETARGRFELNLKRDHQRKYYGVVEDQKIGEQKISLAMKIDRSGTGERTFEFFLLQEKFQ